MLTIFSSALLYALSFPKSPLFFLGFFFLIPMLYALDRKGKGKTTGGFFLFFTFSFLSYLVILYWIPRVMVRYGGMGQTLSILGLIMLAAALSLFNGIAGIFIKKTIEAPKKAVKNNVEKILPVFLIPLIWVGKDLVIEKIFGGFPWCLAGYSQYTNLYFIQMAEIGGIHLVTFVLIYFNILFYRFIKQGDKQTAIVILVSFFSLYTVGYFLYRVNESKIRPLETHRAGIIQPNTTNDPITWVERNKILQRLFKESEELAQKGAEFIVWPEHTVSIYPLQNKNHYQRFMDFVGSHVPLLAGFTDLKGANEIYNSVILFGKGKIEKYDKVHLTPFGEYVLFRELLFFVKRITDEIGDFTPGAAVDNLVIDDHPVSTPICYEIIFPGLVREFISKGGELIITISNDSWFGDTSAPYQHLSMAVFRAIENRRYILRSTTNGISAVILPSGQIGYRSSYYAADRFIGEFKYIKRKTFFNCCGYLFPYFCLFLLAVYIVARKIKFKKKASGGPADVSRAKLLKKFDQNFY